MAAKFTPAGFMLRLIMALALVFATYNPSGYSWTRWFLEAENKIEPFLLLSGIVLLIGWSIFLNATFRSLNAVGLLLGAAFLGAIVWVFISYDILSLENPSALSWVVLTMLAILLGIGISWSHIRRRLTGQLDVDDIEDN